MTEPNQSDDAQTQPQIVQPQPVPTSWSIDPLPQGMVRVVQSTFTGQHVSFMPPDEADQIADMIKTAARTARGSGIVVPPPGLQLPQFPSPNGH